MNKPLTKTLITAQNLEETWDTVTLGKPDGRWALDGDGRLIQRASVGAGNKGASGTILLSRQPLAGGAARVTARFCPGSTYQTGLVVNFQDSKNFLLFAVDRKGPRFKGHRVLVARVRAGRFVSLCREDSPDALPPTVSLAVESREGSLTFSIDGRGVYVLPEQNLPAGARVGLYSQKNTDAVFEPVEVAGAEPQLAPAPTITVPPPAASTDGDASRRDGLMRFLSLQPPRAVSRVPFSEVFTVPLDSFYENLYRGVLATPVSASAFEAARPYRLDFRPRRWYRDYKRVAEAERFAVQDELSIKKLIAGYETKLTAAAEAGGDDFSAIADRLDRARVAYSNALDRLNAIRDRKHEILRELRTNGYTLVRDNTPETVREQGYDFHIIGGAPKPVTYRALAVDPTLNLADDGAWVDLETKLRKRLFDSGVLSDAERNRYTAQADVLKNFEANPALLRKRQDLQAQLAQLQTRLGQVASTADLEAKKGNWAADKETLRSESYKYPGEYYESDFPTRVNAEAIGQFPQRPTAVVGSDSFYYYWLAAGAKQVATLRHPAAERYSGSYFWQHQNWKRDLKAISFELRSNEGNYLSGANATFVALYYPEYGVDYFRFFAWGSSEVREKIPYNSTNTAALLYVSYSYTWGGERSIGRFFQQAMTVCDRAMEEIDRQIQERQAQSAKITYEIGLVNASLEALQKTGVLEERKSFLAYWNNPDAFGAGPVVTNVIPPDVDPLADYLVTLTGPDPAAPISFKTYFFRFSGDGFYTEDGQSLRNFLKSQEARPEDAVAVLPVLDRDGRVSPDVLQALVRPRRSAAPAQMPIIRFVESYQVDIRWSGYALGELVKSFNLFPGETKELTVVRSASRKLSTTESRKEETTESRKETTSLEDNLEVAFSSTDKSSLSQTDTDRASVVKSFNDTTDETTTDKTGFDFGIKTEQVNLGLNMSTDNKKTHTRTNALADTQSKESVKASNQSNETLKKNTHNLLKKAATETSRANRVEVSVARTEEVQTSENETETVRLENPNAGRTVNYNVFQLQNVYEVATRLVDVKIVLSPGVEVIAGSGMPDIRVYELEEFGKIFADADRDDPHAAVLAAIVARQVMKHYANFLPGLTSGNGAVAVRETATVNRATCETLSFTDAPPAPDDFTRDMLERLRLALDDLKSIPFLFKETDLMEPTVLTVNAPAYYLESEVGLRASTEGYLEDRRDIETAKEKAALEHLKAQTQSRVFFPTIPAGVTSLTVTDASIADRGGK